MERLLRKGHVPRKAGQLVDEVGGEDVARDDVGAELEAADAEEGLLAGVPGEKKEASGAERRGETGKDRGGDGGEMGEMRRDAERCGEMKGI